MELDKIGAVLKKRISEQGFTQEEFAEKAGIGLSSLKKYMSGEVIYNVELLDRFANILHCSCDYLLGNTLSPSQEYRSVKDTTRLSDKSLEKLSQMARRYDDELNNRLWIDMLSRVIESDDLVEYMKEYVWTGRKAKNEYDYFLDSMDKAIKQNEQLNLYTDDVGFKIDLSTIMILSIVNSLGQIRSDVLVEDRQSINSLVK